MFGGLFYKTPKCAFGLALKDSVKEKELLLQKISQERDDLSKAIDSLRGSLEVSEKTNKELIHEVIYYRFIVVFR